MKKILVLTLLLLSVAGSAFSAGTPTQMLVTSGAALYGGADTGTAQASINPLVRLSTNDLGVLNYSPDSTTKTSNSYAIITKHTSGSKMFGTSNDATNIYWKAVATGTALTTTLSGSAVDKSNFNVTGSGWTSY